MTELLLLAIAIAAVVAVSFVAGAIVEIYQARKGAVEIPAESHHDNMFTHGHTTFAA